MAIRERAAVADNDGRRWLVWVGFGLGWRPVGRRMLLRHRMPRARYLLHLCRRLARGSSAHALTATPLASSSAAARVALFAPFGSSVGREDSIESGLSGESLAMPR